MSTMSIDPVDPWVVNFRQSIFGATEKCQNGELKTLNSSSGSGEGGSSFMTKDDTTFTRRRSYYFLFMDRMDLEPWPDDSEDYNFDRGYIHISSIEDERVPGFLMFQTLTRKGRATCVNVTRYETSSQIFRFTWEEGGVKIDITYEVDDTVLVGIDGTSWEVTKFGDHKPRYTPEEYRKLWGEDAPLYDDMRRMMADDRIHRHFSDPKSRTLVADLSAFKMPEIKTRLPSLDEMFSKVDFGPTTEALKSVMVGEPLASFLAKSALKTAPTEDDVLSEVMKEKRSRGSRDPSIKPPGVRPDHKKRR